MNRTAYTMIAKHNWKNEVVGYEVREANAPKDTAADCLAYVRTEVEALAAIAGFETADARRNQPVYDEVRDSAGRLVSRTLRQR